MAGLRLNRRLSIAGIAAALAAVPALALPQEGGPAVALVVRMMDCGSTVRPFLCSGVLLEPRVVLTAAHCLRRQPPAGIDVIFGSAVDGTAVHVATGVVHPGYDGSSHAEDLALLFLAEPAPPGFVPVRIRSGPLGDQLAGREIQWIGYGAPFAGEGAGAKRSGKVPILAVSEAEIRYGSPGATSCRGDSGGPVLLAGEEGDELVGITTWGDPACKSFGVAARIDRHLELLRGLLRDAADRSRSRPPFDPQRGVGAPCQTDADCPEETACFGWPGQERWCTYGGLPPGTFGRPCSAAAECGGENLCVALPGGCRCFERRSP